jgi:hypothetical protein
MACVECRGHALVSACPCCTPDWAWDEEEEDEAEKEAVEDAKDNDFLWCRLAAAGYEVNYEYDGEVAVFESAEKRLRRVTRTARRDHKDGKVKAGQRYVETATRYIGPDGRSEHKVTKRVIG